jgi:O-antigen/teichoic acid export membrane protein
MTDSSDSKPENEQDKQIKDDVKSLRRGFMVNVFGYIPKIVYPILLVFVVRLYGKERYGVFKVVEAFLFLSLYLASFGLDKGILWWIPRQDRQNELSGLKQVLVLVGGASVLIALFSLLFAPWIADWKGKLDATDSLRIMAPAVIPLTLMQILVHAALGKRAVEAQVLGREALASAVMVAVAIGLFYTPLSSHGLSIAFVASNVAGLIGVTMIFRRNFRGSDWPKEGWRPPPEMVRYSIPMWLTGLVAAAMLRIDMVGVAALANQRWAGVYAAVLDVGKAIRTVHMSFSQIVLAVTSEISVSRDRTRLIAGFSYATILVMGILLPLGAFLVSFAEWIMPIFGKGFGEGSQALVIVAAFGTVEGILGLNGHLIAGYGKSKLTLLNMCVTLGAQAVLLYVLVPRYGISGAALATGIAFFVQNVLQLGQGRLITGGWSYDANVGQLLLWASVGLAVGFGGRWLMLPMNRFPAAVVGFIGFGAIFGLALLRIYRKSKPTEGATP